MVFLFKRKGWYVVMGNFLGCKSFAKVSILLLILGVFTYLFSGINLKKVRKDYPIVIGKGGRGEIRTNKDDGIAIKVSVFSDACGDYKDEFDDQEKVYKAYKSLKHPKGFKERATMLKPYEYSEGSDPYFCVFKMERLKPYPKGSKLLRNLVLGEESLDKKDKDKGHMTGLKQAKKIIDKLPRYFKDKSNMEQLCYDFGRLAAIMQLVAKVDGYDYELILSQSSSGDIPYKISIIDFDKVNSIKNEFKEKSVDVDKLAECLADMNITPKPTSKSCYNYFKQGYLDLAKQLDKEKGTTFYSKVATELFEVLPDF